MRFHLMRVIENQAAVREALLAIQKNKEIGDSVSHKEYEPYVVKGQVFNGKICLCDKNGKLITLNDL